MAGGAGSDVTAAFFSGSGLPGRWQQRDHFTVLDTAFEQGHRFLATWQAWCDDPLRCARLTFIALQVQPETLHDLLAAHAGSALSERAALLCAAWPPLTANLHALSFERGRVRLLLAPGRLQHLLPELVAEVDAFHLARLTGESGLSAWTPRVSKALGRLAARGATLVACSTEPGLRASLVTAGFDVQPIAADAAPMLAQLAPDTSPRVATRRVPARRAAVATGERRALIVGAGLAGCATAWALAEQGWRSTLIDRHAQPASEGSGNAAGLFHGIVNPQDSVHARFNRAAALAACEAVGHALRTHGVSGAAGGLLRLESTLDVAQMQARIDALGLPPDYVQGLSREAASARSGLALAHPAWFYPGGGWVQPAGLARSFIERASAFASLRFGTAVQTLQRTSAGWALRDASGRVIDEAPVLVLANAGDALRLLGEPGWPVQRVRGQVSGWPHVRPTTPGSPPVCRLPVAGSGYLLPPVDGTVWFGATSQPGDTDPGVREADHAANLAQLRRLTGVGLDAAPDIAPAALLGRTAWRWSANDRLPLVGAVPDVPSMNAATPDQVRLVPRQPGLYVFTALGSRGITWSALGARVLAATLAGAPVPLEASLLDAVDPARFVVRARRRSQGGSQADADRPASGAPSQRRNST